LAPAPPVIQKTYGLHDIDTYVVEADDVLASLLKSARLTPEEYDQRSRSAAATVGDRYGAHVFERAMSDLRDRANDRAARDA
jgi:hypothetical protein